MARAHLRVVPAALHLEREATAERVLAQAALDHQQAIARDQRGELGVGLAEKRALEPPAAVLDLHEHLCIAFLAHRDHLAADDRVQLRTPAAARGLRARLPDAFEVAEVVADQTAQFLAVRIERMAAEVMAERVALAVEQLRERPLVGLRQVDMQRRAGRLRLAGEPAAEQRVLARGLFARELVGGLDHFGQLQHQARAILAQAVERAGLGQRLQRAAVELAAVDPPGEIQQVDERSGAAVAIGILPVATTGGSAKPLARP